MNQHRNVTIPLDWDALELAVERNAPDSESFLDLTTGVVVNVVSGEPEAPALRLQIAENIGNYLRVEPASSREQYRWMEKFVTSVVDDGLRERLLISIDGKGAFRRFKDVLLAYPAERERWFSYRADLLHWHIHNWLTDHSIVAENDPPWGVSVPPPELEQVAPKPVAPMESPGESLRRQARELIDVIPAIDLPSALAFLEFLRERGHDALVRGGENAPAAVRDSDAIDPDGHGDDQGGGQGDGHGNGRRLVAG